MMFDPRLAAALMFPPAAFCDPSASLALLATTGQQPPKLFSPPRHEPAEQIHPPPQPASGPTNRVSPSPCPAPASASSFRIDSLLEQPQPALSGLNMMFGGPSAQQLAVQHILAQMGTIGPQTMMATMMDRPNREAANGTNALDCLADESPLPDGNQPASPLGGRHSPHSSAPETPSGGDCSAGTPGAGSGGGGGKKARKARTIFTDKQLQELETMFERHKYLSVQDRMELARRMNLSDTQVKTWYQNRRTKWKRQAQAGVDLLQEQQNLVAVQNLLRTNPQFWAPWIGQMAQNPFFAQRLLPAVLATSSPTTANGIGIGLPALAPLGEAEKQQNGNDGQSPPSSGMPSMEQQLLASAWLKREDNGAALVEPEGRRKRKAVNQQEDNDDDGQQAEQHGKKPKLGLYSKEQQEATFQ